MNLKSKVDEVEQKTLEKEQEERFVYEKKYKEQLAQEREKTMWKMAQYKDQLDKQRKAKHQAMPKSGMTEAEKLMNMEKL